MVDVATGVARALFAAVGAGRPIRLFCGVSCSFLLKTVIHVTARLSPESVFWLTLDELNLTWWIVIVVPLFFAPVVFGRRGATENIAAQVNGLDLIIDRGNFSPAQRRMIWHGLVDKYVKAVTPDLSKEQDLKVLLQQSMDEAGLPSGSDTTPPA